MSVSDDTGGEKQKPNWVALRHEYENTTISQRGLARKYGLSRTTTEWHARREGWIQRAKLIRKSAAEVEAITTEKSVARFKRELQPWIEKEKEKLTRRSVRVITRGISRVEKLQRSKFVEAKDEAYISKAAQTYITTGRSVLGMDDGKAAGGGINLNLLCNQALIQAAPGPVDSQA